MYRFREQTDQFHLPIYDYDTAAPLQYNSLPIHRLPNPKASAGDKANDQGR